MSTPILQALSGCDTPGCDAQRGTRNRLFARVGKRRLCFVCWVVAGRPWPPPDNATPEELHQVELRTRERMLARGGTDRHLVRNGRT
jgi:hypothetical protein